SRLPHPRPRPPPLRSTWRRSSLRPTDATSLALLAGGGPAPVPNPLLRRKAVSRAAFNGSRVCHRATPNCYRRDLGRRSTDQGEQCEEKARTSVAASRSSHVRRLAVGHGVWLASDPAMAVLDPAAADPSPAARAPGEAARCDGHRGLRRAPCGGWGGDTRWRHHGLVLWPCVALAWASAAGVGSSGRVAALLCDASL
ncbi:unnamed protein product, partial [Urochloa humidicola]